MNYVVLKEFLDRFENKRHYKPDEPYKPPNKERAMKLVKLGFIDEAPVPDAGKVTKPKVKRAGGDVGESGKT